PSKMRTSVISVGLGELNCVGSTTSGRNGRGCAGGDHDGTGPLVSFGLSPGSVELQPARTTPSRPAPNERRLSCTLSISATSARMSPQEGRRLGYWPPLSHAVPDVGDPGLRRFRR